MVSFLCAVSALEPAELHLPAIFADNMVIQRRMRDPVFGTSRPGQPIEVDFAGSRYRTSADGSGRWIVHLDPMEAGGPYRMTVKGGNTVSFKDVMVGEVWVASGQSNMEYRVAWAANPDKEVADADPDIRFFTVGRQSTEQPAEDVSGSWVPATSRTALQFSAVAYSFAKVLRTHLKVPIGVINTSWGGTPVESWISRPTLAMDPTYGSIVSSYLDSVPTFRQRRAEYEKRLQAYNDLVYKKDGPNLGYHAGWADYDADASGWQRAELPGAWELTQNLQIDGAVWYRKDIVVPDEWFGKELKLELGPIADLDNTYFNGNQVGRTRENVKEPNKLKRVYLVAPGVVRRGRNVISVRVFNQFGDGGFVGEPEDMRVYPADDESQAISLAGAWMQRIEKRLEPASPAEINQMPESPAGPGHPKAPGGLWNGMVAPILPYGIKGAIWYQGESNAPRAYAYRRLFSLMIRDWRDKWGEGQFPLYFVQLPSFRSRRSDPTESDWAELREAQFMALKLPNTGMAVTLDIGDAGDIHPKNKREVGRRLALHALARDYGERLIRCGPLYRSARIEGREVQVFFDAVAQRLKTRDGGPVRGFSMAGPDHRFYWADARISGSSVVVSCPKVRTPVAVRYAWADNPDCNLVNSAGLLASPFRTDDWPGVTVQASGVGRASNTGRVAEGRGNRPLSARKGTDD